MATQKKSNISHSNDESNIERSTDTLFDLIRKGKDVETILTLLQKGVDIDGRNSEGYTCLVLACVLCRKHIVELLIMHGAKIDGSVCPFNRTVLHYASGYGWTEVVQSLVKRFFVHPSIEHIYCSFSCDERTSLTIDARDVKGKTALHLASLYGHFEVVKCLVEGGAATDASDECIETALHLASSTGHLEVVKFLVEKGADIDARNKKGETALHRASCGGHLEVVKCLLNGGADMEVKSSGTPLLWAAKYSCLDVVRLLIESGANLYFCEDDMQTLLHFASEHGWVEVAESIVNRVSYLHSIMGHTDNIASCEKGMCSIIHAIDINGRTALNIAVRHAHVDVVQCLVELGVDLNARNKFDDTLLHEAISLGHQKVTKYIVEKGANMNLKNLLGLTPMFVAAKHNRTDVIAFLVNSGADLEEIDEDQCTILHYASTRKHWMQIAQLVSSRMPDLNARNKKGETALFQASVCRNLEVVECLVVAGADMNVPNYSGTPPLLAAARRNHRAVVDLLLNSEANLNVRDENLRTVLHYASKKGWIRTVQFLVRNIPDLDARDKNGETALFAACRGNGYSSQMDVVEYLLQAGARSNILNNDGNSPLGVIFILYGLTVAICRLFIQNGAYLMPPDYNIINSELFLKRSLLTDVNFCSQAVVNKFNTHDLPAIYKLPVSRNLPEMVNVTIRSGSKVFQDIEQAVEFQIMRQEYCDVLQVRPIALLLFSAQSILKYNAK